LPLRFGIVVNDPPDVTMYHAIVKRIARNAFKDLSDRQVEPLIERAAPNLRHTFTGDHALGGTRHSREAFRAWMERLYRLFPELTFTIRDMMATGPPWNTRLALFWADPIGDVDPSAEIAADLVEASELALLHHRFQSTGLIR
jgi:ketosteroid isomerase-like protein